MMCAETGLDTKKKRAITKSRPDVGESPEINMTAIMAESTEVVLHVEETWSRVYTSGIIKSPRFPIIPKTKAKPKKTRAPHSITTSPRSPNTE